VPSGEKVAARQANNSSDDPLMAVQIFIA
jgi:hypothetical protein